MIVTGGALRIVLVHRLPVTFLCVLSLWPWGTAGIRGVMRHLHRGFRHPETQEIEIQCTDTELEQAGDEEGLCPASVIVIHQ